MARCPECGSTTVSRQNPIRPGPIPVFRWTCIDCNAVLEGDILGTTLK